MESPELSLAYFNQSKNVGKECCKERPLPLGLMSIVWSPGSLGAYVALRELELLMRLAQ